MTYSEKLQSLYSEIRSWALYVCKDPFMADDIVQETIYKFLKKEENYKDIEILPLKRMLKASVKNMYITHLRRLYLILKDPPLSVEDSVKTDSTILTQEIMQEVEKLPKHFQEVISKRIEGYDYKSICDHLHLRMGTVKSRIHFGRKLLKSKI